MWLVGVVGRRRVLLMGVGGIYGCNCKDVYRFLIPTPLVSTLFLSSIPTFMLIFFNIFRSCSVTFL